MPLFAPDQPWLHRLQERGDFYRQIIETTFEGIWVIDASANTVFVNERMSSILGYSIVEMVGRHLFTFMDDEGKVICDQNLARRTQGIREQHEFKLLNKHGAAVWVLMSTSPMHDEHGAYAGALAMVNDITDAKCAAIELERVKGELEKRVAERTQELTELNQKLADLAAHDSLTGLLNRRGLDQRLAQEVASATRYGSSLSLLLLDIDHFKQVNDRGGHAAGDRTLQGLARLLRCHVRQSDVLARLGGEEFVVIAPQTSRDGACVLAERLRHATATSTDVGPPPGVTISIGVAVLGERTSNPTGILDVADTAMYTAKREGRNRICG